MGPDAEAPPPTGAGPGAPPDHPLTNDPLASRPLPNHPPPSSANWPGWMPPGTANPPGLPGPTGRYLSREPSRRGGRVLSLLLVGLIVGVLVWVVLTRQP